MTEMPSNLLRNIGAVVLERVGIFREYKGYFGNKENHELNVGEQNRATHGKDSNRV